MFNVYIVLMPTFMRFNTGAGAFEKGSNDASCALQINVGFWTG